MKPSEEADRREERRRRRSGSSRAAQLDAEPRRSDGARAPRHESRAAAAPRAGRRERRSGAATAGARRAAAARSSTPRSRGPSQGARRADAMTTTTASCHARCRRRASERESQMSAIPNASANTRAAVGTPGRQHALDEVVAVRELGRQRRGDADRADDRRRPGEQRLGLWPAQSTRPGYNLLCGVSPLDHGPPRIHRRRARTLDALADVLACRRGM